MIDLPALDPSKVFRIYAGSNELSPYHKCYANEHTVLRLAVGRFFAHFNGDDPVATYWALRRNAVLYDVPERPVEISGPDVLAFLERIFARRISDMKPGRGRYAIACTHQGGLFMDGILFRLAENRFWYVHPDGDLNTWLLAHNPGFDVTVTDPQSRVLQLQGPKSPGIIYEASDGAIDDHMGYFHAGFFQLGGQEVYVSRTGWTGERGYEIYSQGDKTDCPRFWGHLMTTGAQNGLVFSSMQSMNTRRIEAGILDSGSDFDTSMTPFEAGLEKFIDLEKEGFIGREALLRAKRAKRLYGLLCQDLVPGAGWQVLENGRQVGVVTTGAWSPYLEAGIGYVRFSKSGNWPGKNLSICSSVQESAECEIVELPFYDREKQLARG